MFGTKKETKDDEKLINQIEALLFYKGEEITLSSLKKTLAKKEKEIKEAIEVLKENLKNTALTIIENDEKYLLTINSQYSTLINDIKAEEQFGELSPSALETLAIILYKGPLSKIEIDQIRGINSAYILRNLLIRGLVERKNKDGKTVYLQTIDLMRFLGIDSQNKLPAYQKVLDTLNKIETDTEEISPTTVKNPSEENQSSKQDNIQ